MVAIEVAEKGVFNTNDITPIDAVMESRAFDVLKIFNLSLAK